MKTNKNIENLAKYIIKESSIEEPSADFVDKVMNKISLVSKPVSELTYKPLISKLGWFLISFIFVLLSIYLLTKNFKQSSLFSNFNFSFFNNLSLIHIFKNINIPSTFTFVFVFFTVLVLFQLLIIKKYFEKKIF